MSSKLVATIFLKGDIEVKHKHMTDKCYVSLSWKKTSQFLIVSDEESFYSETNVISKY